MKNYSLKKRLKELAKEEPKEINYWMHFDGLLGFSRIDQISKLDWERPRQRILFAVPKVQPIISFDEGNLIDNRTTYHKLVFEFEQRLETGLIYKFKGWE